MVSKTGIGIGNGIPFGNNSSGGDRPYLSPELKSRLRIVAYTYGKRNGDADRATIRNLVDPDNPLICHNFAWIPNSGYGFTTNYVVNSQRGDVEVLGEQHWLIKSVAQEGEGAVRQCIHRQALYANFAGYTFNIKCSNIKDTDSVRIYYGYDKFLKLKNGDNIVTYEAMPSTDNYYVFDFNKEVENIEIEIEPIMQDALATDGVNDVIESTKTCGEMFADMGNETTISFVSKFHLIDYSTSFTINTFNSIRNDSSLTARNTLNRSRDVSRKDIIVGWRKSISNNSVLSYISGILGDKEDYTATSGEASMQDDMKFFPVGYNTSTNTINELSKIAYEWTIGGIGTFTEDDINQIIAYYNLDRTLKSDIYCNIEKQGITNENHADFNDKLIDYSGNGRDIQLNNLAWKGGSGIAAKQYETFKDWTNTPYQTSTVTEIDEFTRVVDSTSNAYWVSMINRSSDFDKVHDSINIVLYQDDMLLVHECKYKIDENVTTKVLYETLKSGVNTITLATIDKFTDIPEDAEIMSLGEWVNPKSNKGSVKITLLPSYKGGLLLDGVNDFGKVTGMPVYKDYTFIIDRQIISIGDTAGVVASKSEDSADATKHGAFIFECLAAPDKISTWSFYKDNGQVANTDFTRGISYQSTYSYNGKDLTIGTSKDSDKLWLGTIRDNDSRFFNGAIYSLMTFPYSMSEFLIERQLKKHKLGTLYPNMVEFRPVIKSSVELVNKPTFAIRGTSTLLNAGDYIPENSEIWVVITMNNAADRITKFVINGNTIDIPSSAYNPSTMKYGFPFTIDNKSPQKITMTIEQDENYVKFEPVITSNVEYVKLDFYLNNYQKRINIGDYIPKDAYLRANFYLKNNVDELTVFTFNGVNIGYRRSSVDDTAFNIGSIYNYDSPQEVNITIDEYIRYEDIVQPYPLFFEFTDENGNLISWGGKAKVGSTITKTKGVNYANLLEGLFTITNPRLNGVPLASSQHVVEKSMVFTCTATWAFDNNEPKCILSPRLLRIPNSSYKILGYIPDISGHGNHGKINNSAYAEGSGVNEDGSYQFDGVDDFVTIPTTVGGKQVLMKVNWNTINSIIYDQRSSGASPNSLYNDFAIYCTNAADNNLIAYQARLVGNTYIDGILNTNITCEDLLGVLHNITITCDIVAPNNGVVPNIGRGGVLKDLYSNMALYDFMLFDNISTDDKIKELNEYVGIEAKVELPPYYWDTYGKTNSDADRDTIQQRGIAVGDYDLTNYNHAYEGMSGYNGYPIILSGTNRTYRDKASYVNVVGDDKNVINLTRISFNTAAIFSYVKQNGELTSYNKYIESFKIKVTGIDYSRFVIKYSYISEANATAKTTMTIASDGIYELPKSFASDGSLTSSDVWIGINFTKQSNDMPDIIEDVNVTIEVLPEYENGLAYDGVEDYSENVNIPIVDDFTFLVKASLLSQRR